MDEKPQFGKEFTKVEVDGVQFEIDSKAVHLSEDENDWYCAKFPEKPISEENTRCIFIGVRG
jgi:hypothetical protein